MALSILAVFPLILLFLEKSSFAFAACQVPPQFWCDNPDISAECGVTRQCKTLQKLNSKPVDFTLYYESMCPDCINFFKTQMAPAYENVGSIMNLTLVPYGNARHHNDSSLPFKYWFECQHGVEECIGNMLETCAIALYMDTPIYFPFINCVENSSMIPRKAALECANNHGLNYTYIMECVNSFQGRKLEYEMAKKTDVLQPPHEYVPWVTLNGVHTENIQNLAQQNLISLICTTYTGFPKPRACFQ